MNLQAVEQVYLKHYQKLAAKLIRQGAQTRTPAQQRGFAYYLESARRIGLLLPPWNAPVHPGFEMKSADELAPIRMGFTEVA